MPSSTEPGDDAEDILRRSLTNEPASFEQPYGDLGRLNTCRVIADAVPRDVLFDVVADFLNILETSSAIYEANGDYVVGIFSSGWCRTLDAASRRRCQTDDDGAALRSGLWLCHESCWKDASLRAIETGAPIDVPCNGGLRLHAVPIVAAGHIVGAINFGYGSPPSTADELNRIADLYGVPVGELTRLAQQYLPRPAVFIEQAKRRLMVSARLLGALVEASQARKELERSEERYRELFENAHAGIVVYRAVDGGVDFDIVGFNRTAEGIERASRGELVGRRVTEVFPGVESFGLLDVFRRVLRTGTPEGHPASIYRDGRIAEWRENYVFRLPTGEVVAAYNDVTEREEARRALTEMARFPDENPNPVLRVDGEGSLLYKNRAADALLDALTTDEGRRLDEVWQARMRDALTTHDTPQFEVTCRSRTFLLQVAPVAEQHYVNIYATDITERKLAEEARLSMESQVQHVQKLESLGVLAGGIAHDFNNILAGILGNADLALEDLGPSSSVRTCIEDVIKAARRAADLCRQMLAYSGRGRFVISNVDMNDVIVEMTNLLEISISKKVVLRFNLAKGLPTIEADVTQIRQLVMNLVTNAAEAIGERSGTVCISTGLILCDRDYLDTTVIADELPEGVYVSLEVADTGCGMDHETIGRIFDPFFSTKFTGRGLGLAAALGIVRGHGGAIKVYSEPAKGTTFRLLFPASELPAEATVELPSPLAGWQSEGTILVVDDEETVRLVAGRMLFKAGFKVLFAADGREALRIFDEHSDTIRLVLLDLTMPHLDGEETFRELRRRNPDILVVLSSGYNEQEAVSRFAGKKLAGFVQKPYEIHTLLTVVRAALQE